MPRPPAPSNVAASSAATSAWANEVVDAINAALDDIYGATDLEIPWDAITTVFDGTAPTTIAHGDVASAGVATSPARRDHVHGIAALSGTATTQAVGDAANAGTSPNPSRGDHKHGLPAFGAVTPQTAYGAASTSGAATSLARSDHAHGTPAAVTVASLNAPDTANTPNTPTTRTIYVGTATPTGAAEGDLWFDV